MEIVSLNCSSATITSKAGGRDCIIWLLSFNISTAAGQSVGDLADRWISGAWKLKAVRGVACVPERQSAVVSVGS